MEKVEVLNWLFWQAGAAPFLGGGFGHFFNYAPEKLEYPINRFTMEVKRQLDLLIRNWLRNLILQAMTIRLQILLSGLGMDS